MQKFNFITKSILINLCIVFCNSNTIAQTTEGNVMSTVIDMQRVKTIIENIDNQFSIDYFNGDSVALAAHYAKDGKLGSLKGKDILSYWGNSIRYSIKNNERNLKFITTSLTNDSEYLVELGIYEIKDDKNNLKDKGKYLVVWKQEDGRWKIYRDIEL